MSTGFAYDDDAITIDFGASDVDQSAKREYDALPAGEYPVTVLEATHQISANGNKMLVLMVEVSEGEFERRRLWERIAYVPTMQWKLKEAVEALMGTQTGTLTFNLQDLENLTCNVMVEESEYNGKATNKITGWLPAAPDAGNAANDGNGSVSNWDGDF
jgi:hypothetical protein